MEKDPVPLINRYAYTENNPVNFADLTGRCNDEQRYAHAEVSVSETPVPGAQPLKPEKPRFDSCSSPSHFPAMRPSFPFADVYHFVTTNQCLRGVTKAITLGAVTFVAVSSGAGAAVLVFDSTGSLIIAAGAGGIVWAGPGGFRAQTTARLLQGTFEDINNGCF